MTGGYVFRSEASPHPAGVCRHCGGPVEVMQEPRSYCSRRHRRRAYHRRRKGLPGSPRPGECWCGATFDPRIERPRVFCSRGCKEAYSTPAWAEFCKAVVRPHDLTWLARKLSLEADDPRLPTIALAMAEAGKLAIYVRMDGTVGEVGRLRLSTGRADQVPPSE